MNFLLATTLLSSEGGFIFTCLLIGLGLLILGIIVISKFFTLVQRVIFIHERMKMMHEDIKKLLPEEEKKD